MGLFTGRTERSLANPFGYPDIPPNSAVGSAVGTRVDVSTPEAALRKVAVWSSMNLIAGLGSELPVDGFTGTGQDKRQITLPRFFEDPDGSGQGFEDWAYQLLYSWLGRGNAYGYIAEWDANRRPSMIQLQHPDRVSSRRDSAGNVHWTFNGRTVDAERVWHRRVFPIPGHRLGLSPIAVHALTIGQGIAASQFGLSTFLDGAHPSAILQQEDASTVDQTKAQVVKARFREALAGRREPVVLGKGWKYIPIQLTPEESQFLDTQKYTASECARIFGPGVAEVLGYESGGSMTYQNVEQRSIDLLKFTLNRWFGRLEKVLSRDVLPAPRYIKLNRGALLQTDLITRYKAHEIALRNKFEVVNEVRELEDRPPVSWGNEPTPSSTPDPLRLETT